MLPSAVVECKSSMRSMNSSDVFDGALSVKRLCKEISQQIALPIQNPAHICIGSTWVCLALSPSGKCSVPT
jgi:hypothetical protein